MTRSLAWLGFAVIVLTVYVVGTAYLWDAACRHLPR